jgi:hypothetical protein
MGGRCLMPKIRGFKSDLWTDEDFVELSPLARLLWMGMWNYCCDNGHIADRSKQIKMRVLPTDDANCAELLREIEARGLIVRGDGWITVPNFTRHQKPDRRYFQTCEYPGCERPADNPEPKTRGGNAGARGGHASPLGDGEVKGSEVMVKGTRKRATTSLPSDWQPTEKHWQKRSEGIDVQREAEKFRLHAEATGRAMVNWNAAFSQWLLNARPTPGAAVIAAAPPLDPSALPPVEESWMRRRPNR